MGSSVQFNRGNHSTYGQIQKRFLFVVEKVTYGNGYNGESSILPSLPSPLLAQSDTSFSRSAMVGFSSVTTDKGRRWEEGGVVWGEDTGSYGGRS